MKKKKSTQSIASRVLVILAVIAVFVAGGLLLILERSCGADQPAPAGTAESVRY